MSARVSAGVNTMARLPSYVIRGPRFSRTCSISISRMGGSLICSRNVTSLSSRARRLLICTKPQQSAGMADRMAVSLRTGSAAAAPDWPPTSTARVIRTWIVRFMDRDLPHDFANPRRRPSLARGGHCTASRSPNKIASVLATAYNQRILRKLDKCHGRTRRRITDEIRSYV